MEVTTVKGFIRQQILEQARKTLPEVTYELGGKHYRVALDLKGIERKLNELTQKSRPFVGGLLPVSGRSHMTPSVSNYQPEHNIIVINPVGWRIKFVYATGLHRRFWDNVPEDERVEMLVAMLLAHESRHIQQGIMHYGMLKTPLIMPGTILGPYAVVFGSVLALGGVMSWTAVLWILSYTAVANLAYWYDWREVDARRYAREHWRDWLPLITVTRI